MTVFQQIGQKYYRLKQHSNTVIKLFRDYNVKFSRPTYLPIMCIDIAFDFTPGLIVLLQTILPVTVSVATKCASLVITKTSPIPGLSEISDTDSCELFKLRSENFAFIETTAEEVLDSVFERNKTDDELISSIATCKVDEENISWKSVLV